MRLPPLFATASQTEDSICKNCGGGGPPIMEVGKHYTCTTVVGTFSITVLEARADGWVKIRGPGTEAKEGWINSNQVVMVHEIG